MANWNTIAWDSGDTVSGDTLNNMTGNTQYIKEEGSDYIMIFASNATAWTASVPTDEVDIYINAPGATFGSTGGTVPSGSTTGTFTASATTAEDFTKYNFDVSALSGGLHTIYFDLSSGLNIRKYRFIKTDQLNYMTFWFTLRSDQSPPEYGMYGISVIGHNDSEVWT